MLKQVKSLGKCERMSKVWPMFKLVKSLVNVKVRQKFGNVKDGQSFGQ